VQGFTKIDEPPVLALFSISQQSDSLDIWMFIQLAVGLAILQIGIIPKNMMRIETSSNLSISSNQTNEQILIPWSCQQYSFKKKKN
jgi:hypothetical protein